MERRSNEVTKDIIKKLATISGKDVRQRDPEGEKLYQ